MASIILLLIFVTDIFPFWRAVQYHRQSTLLHSVFWALAALLAWMAAVGIEAMRTIDPDGRAEIVVNLQGDFPTIAPDTIRAALSPLDDPTVDIATLASQIHTEEEDRAPSVVKAVGSPIGPNRLRALYFTRATAPHGDGPRPGHKCPAEDIVAVAVKLYLVVLLRRSRWEVPPQDLTLTNELFPLPTSGLEVQFHPYSARAESLPRKAGDVCLT